MNIQVVPLQNTFPWYQFRTTISGVVYTLVLRYNTRMDRWIMDINDSVGNSIIVGIPLLIGRDLTGQYVITGIPTGTFVVADDTNLSTQPTRYSFGTDHTLFYSDPDGTNPFGVT